MSLKDVGITEDIQGVACSLNDIFKETFELMTGTLGKHGVYYLPEMRHQYDYRPKLSGENKMATFHASNGWMKNPLLKAVKEISSGALRKYRVPASFYKREILLVCIGCLEISAEGVNFCYEANWAGKNASGTISTGPIVFTLNLQLRITKVLKIERDNNISSCGVKIGEKSLDLSEWSNIKSEVRGLRSLNFLADNITSWTEEHLNSTVRAQLETRLLASFDKVSLKHDMCEEFISN